MPKPVESCMFCDPEPCGCRGKKAAPKKPRKRASNECQAETKHLTTPVVTTQSSLDTRQTVDLKAAMKAAVSHTSADMTSTQSVTAAEPPQVMQAIRAATQEVNDEFGVCVNALASILHPTDLDRYSEHLTPTTRARLWRSRNE